MREILDLDRYPIDRTDPSDYAALVARCQAELAGDGMVSLPQFMRPDIAQQVADQIEADMAKQSFHHLRDHNIYFDPDLSDIAADHPALTQFRTSNHTLCADQITDTAVTKLYEFPPLRQFLADVMSKPELHLMADPLARLNVMSYGAEDGLNWHFDRSEFTVTLLLQAPMTGGVFEYRTGLRSKSDPNYDGVGRLVQGHDPKVQQVTMTAGTLTLFKGANTAHRVTPVIGPRKRVMAVLSYYEEPGVTFTPEEQKGFYDRSA